MFLFPGQYGDFSGCIGSTARLTEKSQTTLRHVENPCFLKIEKSPKTTAFSYQNPFSSLCSAVTGPGVSPRNWGSGVVWGASPSLAAKPKNTWRLWANKVGRFEDLGLTFAGLILICV